MEPDWLGKITKSDLMVTIMMSLICLFGFFERIKR